MAGSAVTIRHGSVTLKTADGAPIAVTLTETGSGLSVEGLEEGLSEVVPVYYRGVFSELVKGQDKTITGSIELVQDGQLTHATTKKILDAVLKTGAFAAGATRDPGGVVWTSDIEWTGTRNGVSSAFRLRNCRLVANFSEGADPGNKITINYTAYGTGAGDQFAFI